MKAVISAVLCAILLLLTIPACKKNDNSNGSWTAAVNSAAINGTFVNASYFSANGKLIVTLTPSASVVYPAITLQGVTDSAGTMILDSNSVFSGSYTDSATGVIYSTVNHGNGQFVISTFTPGSTNLISGSFNFTAHNPINFGDSLVITKGMFNNIGIEVQ